MEHVKTLLNKIRDKAAYLREFYLNFRYKGVLCVAAIFALITFLLFAERSGIHFNYTKRSLDILPAESVMTKAEAMVGLPKKTIVFYDSTQVGFKDDLAQFEVIMADMKVGCDYVDLASGTAYDLYRYDKAVALMYDLSAFGNEVITLAEWVYDGGGVLFPITLEKNAYSSALMPKLGIVDASYDYIAPESIYIEEPFMVGGGRTFNVLDAYDSAWIVRLDPQKVRVHAYTGGERQVPLIWSADYGKGRFVVNNLGFVEKSNRGFYAASYSLLGDYCVYPVINGSTFYLDDFPSQIPSGNNEYIQQEFNTSVRDFYVNIWWPDMMNFADQYGLKYTGLAIESYDDATDGSTDGLVDKGTFLNFGNMLLRQGGEIGYHGYNHQPLCFDNCDYKGFYDYKTWESYGAMTKAFDELIGFCDELFPDIGMSVYVPPSNIMSTEGRAMMVREYPWIHTVSGVYIGGNEIDFYCTQEYDIGADGVVDQPRAISGCYIDDFMQLVAVSELNMHFSNSHFTHPDDALDPDRGALMGWGELKRHFNLFLTWLYDSAPTLRNLTGSEMSAAVQRFASVSVLCDETDDVLTLNIRNFTDDAQFFLRLNEWDAGKVKGGKLTHITGNLYLLSATDETVKITKKPR